MVDFTIEPAKSGRSSCKACRQKIAAGEVRVGVISSHSHHDETSWHHVACFAKSKHAANQDLEEIDGYTSLSSTEKAAAKKDFDSAGKTAKAAAAKKSAKGAKKGKKQSSDESESESESGSESDSGKGKKSAATKKGAKASSSGGGALAGYTASERETYKEHLEEALEKSVAALKTALKKNGMTQTGNKGELAARLADCQTLGTLPNCSKCGGGRLKFDQKAGIYFCKGYMDDADYVNCSAKFQRSEVTRGTWAD